VLLCCNHYLAAGDLAGLQACFILTNAKESTTANKQEHAGYRGMPIGCKLPAADPALFRTALKAFYYRP
jgi:hypothetical protein